MATTAHPVGALDFAHNHPFPESSYSYDRFDDDKTVMSGGFDPEFLHNLFTPSAEDQSLAPKPIDFSQSNVAANAYYFAATTSAASTSSDQQAHRLTSGDPSNMGSPELHFPPFGNSSLSDFNSSGYMSSAEHSSFSLEQFPDTELVPDYQALLAGEKQSGFVDPSLLSQGVLTPNSLPSNTGFPQHPPPASPALSQASSHSLSRTGSNHLKSSRSQSPYLQSHQWQPYTKRPFAQTPRSESGDFTDSEREKNRCPHPECGKIFKDLKAHMLTHQNERPEKCPIPSCEYSKKGFSRKYDKNRHTLTHYKGNMVCGFCPGSGSSQEKSFNRADVFKRHLTTVHGVEQNPPNSRKKPSAAAQARSSQNVGDATGSCSICHAVFSNAQDFYEHLEDCVLDVVQKTDPAEAINEQLLSSVADDEHIKASLERNNLPTSLGTSMQSYGFGEDDHEEDDDDNEDSQALSKRRPGQTGSSHINDRGAISKPSTGGRRTGPGLTYSKGGVPLSRQGRKRRKNYPNSWGCSAEKMKMKKRVLTVWDGQRRLAKDDMMLHSDFEVRLPLPDAGNGAYVTDLDVQTLRRASGFFEASEEERGPWESCMTNVPDGSGIGLVP